MNTQRLRNEMVERQIAARGVRDARVLSAMRKVPREHFMPPEFDEFAYEDSPQPLPRGQTISQPYIVALMIEALRLKGDETVLEIGAGFGYAAAVLGQVAARSTRSRRSSTRARRAGEPRAAGLRQRSRPPRRRHARLARTRAI